MEQNKNYQKELEKIIQKELNRVPTLLLHSCCAPCSSYVLEYLSRYFKITLLYYNPNISMQDEYERRTREQEKLIQSLNQKGLVNNIDYLQGDYEPKLFFDKVKGYEDCKEGGQRCALCFRMRLEEAVKVARKLKFDYVTTTLTISPMKNAGLLNSIGESLGNQYEVKWLPSDFKKKGGYQRSVQLSKEYDLYRQDYCGCIFSKVERGEA